MKTADEITDEYLSGRLTDEEARDLYAVILDDARPDRCPGFTDTPARVLEELERPPDR